MHKFFGEWYRVAEIDPKGDDLPKRWVGVESTVESLDTAKALDVARLFSGSTTVTPEFREQFALTFQKADASFPMRNNELELRILAGATIVHYVESKRT